MVTNNVVSYQKVTEHFIDASTRGSIDYEHQIPIDAKGDFP